MTPFEEKLKEIEKMFEESSAWMVDHYEGEKFNKNSIDHIGLELIRALRECLSVLEKKDEAFELIISDLQQRDKITMEVFTILNERWSIQPSFLKEKSDE